MSIKPFGPNQTNKLNDSSLDVSLLSQHTEEKLVSYEEALNEAGAENTYQSRVGVLVAFGMAIAGLQVMSFPFLFKEPEVQCLNTNNNWYDCEITAATCKGLMRLKPGAPETIPASFHQFCEGSGPRILVETIYMIASALGVALIGPLGDRYGKRIALLISYLITCLSLLAAGFAPTWEVFVILIVLSGLGRAPFIYYGFQLLVEVSNENFRALGTLIMGVSFALGAAFAGLFSEMVDYNWRKLYLFFLAIPSLIGFPLVFSWADESPLSFFPLHDYEKARKGLYKIAAVNKRYLPYIRFTEEKNYSENSDLRRKIEDGTVKGAHDYSILDLFRYRSLRKAALGGSYICFVTYFVFYGQMLAVDSLSNDPVTVSVITSVVEALACIVSVKFITKLKRKSLLLLGFSLTAIAFIIFGLFPISDNCSSGDINCSKVGKYISYIELSVGRFWVAMLMCTTFVYTNELFPTVIRSRGSGLVNFFGRIGSFIPSTVIYFCNKANISPALVFGLVAVPAAIASLFMIETKGKPLQNHIEEEDDHHTQYATLLHNDEKTNDNDSDVTM